MAEDRRARDWVHRNVLGDNQYVKLTGEDTGGAYALIEQVNTIGTGIPRHAHHNEQETFYINIIEGEYEFKPS